MQKWQVILVRWAVTGGSAMRSFSVGIFSSSNSKNVGLTAVYQAFHTDCRHGACLLVILKAHARQVFGGLPGNHLSGLLRIEHAEMAGTFENLRRRLVRDRTAHMRAHRAIRNDVAIRADAARYPAA